MTNEIAYVADYIKQVADGAVVIFNFAPAIFTVFITIILAYAPRIWPRFPNEKLPIFCVIVGTFLFCALNEKPASVVDGWGIFRFAVRTFFSGVAFSLLAWLLHDKVISRFEDKLPILGKLLNWSDQKRAERTGNTDRFTKPPETKDKDP